MAQSAAPAALVGANEFLDGPVLAQHHGVALAEGGVELVGIAAQKAPISTLAVSIKEPSSAP